MEKRELKVSVAKFDKIPWLSEGSLTNKPLVLSLPKRSPRASAFLISPKKDTHLPILFQAPDVLSKVQPRTLMIPHKLKLSFENLMSHRMMSPPPPKAKTVSKDSGNDVSAENIHYRLPILGPRRAVFHGLLADTYKSLQETQVSSLPRKEPVGKKMRQ
ncbi:uncharacterized protein C1orf105 homolog isoform X3 [Suricata suricatta]|uniref:uncharacterized protein C1orf105 homolog isoform X3 n=1 Tax=Suricata suricatta TaxID=37032 RepID=UPI001155D4DA|nr:uncharacterized protein C1orf105 homolog isoform X3 [Suricata suricatta]